MKSEIRTRIFYEHKGNDLMIARDHSLAYGAHLHSHLEMVCMIDGTAKAIIDSSEYVIEKDDIFLIFPNQIHTYERLGDEDYYIFIFPDTFCSEYYSLFTGRLPETPLIKGGFRSDAIRTAAQAIEKEASYAGNYTQYKIKGFLLVILSTLFETMTFTSIKNKDTDLIKKILLYCSENFKQNIDLNTVANELHVNPCYISSLLRKKLQIGFSDYVNMLRVSEACHLLSDPSAPITDIAYQAGFNSPRSFNRAFSKHMGTTPRSYRDRGPQNTIGYY